MSTRESQGNDKEESTNFPCQNKEILFNKIGGESNSELEDSSGDRCLRSGNWRRRKRREIS